MPVQGGNFEERRERLVSAFYRARADRDTVLGRMRERAVRLAFARLSDHMWAERVSALRKLRNV